MAATELKKRIQDARLGIGMLLVQVIATGLQLLSRVILNQGLFVFAYMFYRHIVGAVCVAPFALFFERSSGMKLKSWSVFFWLFAVALTGISMAMGLFYYGLRDTTATYATNFLNLIPIFSFLLSTILGIEKLRLHTKRGKVKTMGATVCLGGALVIAFYKGKDIRIIHHSLDEHHPVLKMGKPPQWTRGTIFLICSCLSYGLWFISQAKLFAIYPHKFWATFYTCLIASVQQVSIGLCIDRSKAAWHLGWNLQLLTIFYSGALATAVTFCLISWAVAKRGPTYPSMFNPLSLIFVAIAETLILGLPLSVGSLLGMFLIFAGIYSFLWAKNKEARCVLMKTTLANTVSSSNNTGEAAEKPAIMHSGAAVVPPPSPPNTINQLHAQRDGNQHSPDHV